MKRKQLILAVLALGIAVFVAGAWYMTRPAPIAATDSVAPQQADALMRSYSPILGPEEAPVTIVEFFDPACEACRAFYPVVKDIMARHGNAVRVVLRYTPFHGKASEQAIKVLEAARMQELDTAVQYMQEKVSELERHGASEAQRAEALRTAAQGGREEELRAAALARLQATKDTIE